MNGEFRKRLETSGDGPLKRPMKALKLLGLSSAPCPACAGEGCSLTPSFHLFLLITEAEKSNESALLACSSGQITLFPPWRSPQAWAQLSWPNSPG